MDGAQCPRCLQFEDEVRELQQRLASRGQYITFSPGPNPNLDVEYELKRWLSVSPGVDASAGFRAGWARLARFVRPKLRDWEVRWWRGPRGQNTTRRPGGPMAPGNL